MSSFSTILTGKAKMSNMRPEEKILIPILVLAIIVSIYASYMVNHG